MSLVVEVVNLVAVVTLFFVVSLFSVVTLCVVVTLWLLLFFVTCWSYIWIFLHVECYEAHSLAVFVKFSNLVMSPCS